MCFLVLFADKLLVMITGYVGVTLVCVRNYGT